jgi:uncharacterized protein (DUF4415 family)
MRLTKSQAKQIRTLKRMKDEDIDFTDIPEKTDWSKAVVGKFYRPIKKSLTIRIDADVLAWIRGRGKGYQTRINRYLREKMQTSNKYHWQGIVSLESPELPRFARESIDPSTDQASL